MDALIEYIIVGIIALALAFVTTPLLIQFYADAVSQASNNTDIDENTSDLIQIVLLLVLLMFYFFLVWIMYGAVKDRV